MDLNSKIGSFLDNRSNMKYKKNYNLNESSFSLLNIKRPFRESLELEPVIDRLKEVVDETEEFFKNKYIREYMDATDDMNGTNIVGKMDRAKNTVADLKKQVKAIVFEFYAEA